MRFFQLTSKAQLTLGDPDEEAILEVTGQQGTILQVFDRLPLGVQDPLYSLDDVSLMGEEELKKFDVCLKRHLTGTRSGWPLFGRLERMKSHAPEGYYQRL